MADVGVVRRRSRVSAVVRGARRERLGAVFALVLGLALCVGTVSLTGCTSMRTGSQERADDRRSLVSAMERIVGVDAVDVGGYSTGVPGDYALLITLTLEFDRVAAIGGIVRSAVAEVTRSPGDYSEYTFGVVVPTTAVGDELIVVSLAEHEDEIDLDGANYLGSTMSLERSALLNTGRPEGMSNPSWRTPDQAFPPERQIEEGHRDGI